MTQVMWGHPRRRPSASQEKSSHQESVGTLNLDLPAPRSVRNKFLWSKPVSLWRFVIVAQADWDICPCLPACPPRGQCVARRGNLSTTRGLERPRCESVFSYLLQHVTWDTLLSLPVSVPTSRKHIQKGSMQSLQRGAKLEAKTAAAMIIAIVTVSVPSELPFWSNTSKKDYIPILKLQVADAVHVIGCSGAPALPL